MPHLRRVILYYGNTTTQTSYVQDQYNQSVTSFVQQYNFSKMTKKNAANVHLSFFIIYDGDITQNNDSRLFVNYHKSCWSIFLSSTVGTESP